MVKQRLFCSFVKFLDNYTNRDMQNLFSERECIVASRAELTSQYTFDEYRT